MKTNRIITLTLAFAPVISFGQHMLQELTFSNAQHRFLGVAHKKKPVNPPVRPNSFPDVSPETGPITAEQPVGSIFIEQRSLVVIMGQPGNVFVATSEVDSSRTRKYTIAEGQTSVTITSQDGKDFRILGYASDADLQAGNAAAAVDVLVAQPHLTNAVALTGVGYRGPSAASGYKLTPILDPTTKQVTGQRISQQYLDQVDLNFSAGLQFVFAEDAPVGFLERVFSLGQYKQSHNRFGFMLAINQPANGGSSSVRFGPILYLHREMDVAITFGVEAFQAQRFQPGTYSFGDTLPVDGSVNQTAVTNKWMTGFFFGFVYKVGS